MDACTLSTHNSECPGNTDINSSYNSQSDNDTTGLDLEGNQQTSQLESMTELATVFPIAIQDDFLWYLYDNVSKHFPELFFVMGHGVVGTTTNIPV